MTGKQKAPNDRGPFAQLTYYENTKTGVKLGFLFCVQYTVNFLVFIFVFHCWTWTSAFRIVSQTDRASWTFLVSVPIFKNTVR